MSLSLSLALPAVASSSPTDDTAVILLLIAGIAMPIVVFLLIRRLNEDPGDGDPR